MDQRQQQPVSIIDARGKIAVIRTSHEKLALEPHSKETEVKFYDYPIDNSPKRTKKQVKYMVSKSNK